MTDTLGPEWRADNLMPDDEGPDTPVLGGATKIAYVGKAYTRGEFRAYAQTLDLRDVGGIVLHHTAIPSASWGRYPTGAVWDAHEEKLDVGLKVDKRLRQLRAIFDFYQDRKGWPAGPQLFIDDLRIYVGSPLEREGIHAGNGNRYIVGGRRLHTIGIEVVGFFDRERWPEPVARNVAWAVGVLRQRLAGRLALVRRVGVMGDVGGIAEHRDFTDDKTCPGTAIQHPWYLPLFEGAYRELQGAQGAPLPPGTHPVDDRLLAAWSRSGGVYVEGQLTPGYALSPARKLADGTVEQRFERGVAVWREGGPVTWRLLSELGAKG